MKKSVLYFHQSGIQTDQNWYFLRGYIATQQSQPLYTMTTSPNIWKFPAPRYLVSLMSKKACEHIITGWNTNSKRRVFQYSYNEASTMSYSGKGLTVDHISIFTWVQGNRALGCIQKRSNIIDISISIQCGFNSEHFSCARWILLKTTIILIETDKG